MSKSFIDTGALATSVLAFLISLVSLAQSCTSANDAAYMAAIQTAYQGYNDLTEKQIEEWQLSHLFALPEEYGNVKKNITDSITPLDGAKRAELLLREQAIAEFIFNEYEKTFYELKHVTTFKDSNRIKFFEDTMDYYRNQLLRNPRLLYYWPKLKQGFTDEVQKDYDENIAKKLGKPVNESEDSLGPFIVKSSNNENQNPGQTRKPR
jgi:hypothetical protein